MNDYPLRVEYEPEFIERFETLRIALSVDSMQPMIWKLRKQSLLTGILFVVGSLAGTAAFMTLTGIPFTIPFYGVFVATILIWAFIWIYRYFFGTKVAASITKMIYETARGHAGPGYTGIGSIEISDDALFLSDKYVSNLFRWPCIWEIRRTKAWSHLLLTDRRWLLIPARAFENDDEYQLFIDEIEQRNLNHGGAEGIITEHLKEYTLACPDCSYPLHQIPQARCPECGRDIGFDDFRTNTSEYANIDESVFTKL